MPESPVARSTTGGTEGTGIPVPGATRRVARRLRALAADGGLDLPFPGAGETWGRWRGLAGVAADDLALARLAEGHADAVAILHEAGRPGGGGLYGVFAARGPDSTVTARPVAGGWHLGGRRRYASGARVLDRALVDVDGPRGPLLVDLDLRASGVTTAASTWHAVGMAATDTVTLVLEGVVVDPDAVVGPSGFYVDRPGFGHGGAGVAACWWGGAVGLVRGIADHAATRPPGPRRQRAVAAALAVTDLATVLEAAAVDLDRHPDDLAGSRRRAAHVRASVHRGCGRVLDDVLAAGGTHGATADAAQARRLADLPVYLTQFGGAATLDDLDPRDALTGLVAPPGGREPGPGRAPGPSA